MRFNHKRSPLVSGTYICTVLIDKNRHPVGCPFFVSLFVLGLVRLRNFNYTVILQL